MYGYDMMNYQDWGWGFMIMLFWIVVITVVTILLLRSYRGHEMSVGHKTTPLEIAKERYAKGDITKEQFEQLKKDLN